MPKDPLKAARLKVERALSHLEEVRSRIVLFYRSEPFPLTHWVEDVDGGETKVIKLHTRAIPDEVAIAVGDTVGNLRSALDYAANQLAHITGRQPLIHFPFASSKRQFETDQRILRSMDAMPEEAQTFIREVEPYRGGNDYFWSLTRVRNLDTHRGLVPLGVSVPGLSSRMALLAGSSEPLLFGVPNDPVRFGYGHTAVLMRVPASGSGPDYDYDLTMDVGFGDVEVVRGQSVTSVLGDYCNMVEGILDVFDKTFFKP